MTIGDSRLRKSHRQFLSLEDELQLFDLQIDGVYLWERIRNTVRFKTLQAEGLIEAGSGSKSSSMEYLYAVRNLLKNTFVKNPFLASEHDVLFWGRGRRQFDQGHWWEMQCDPIHSNLQMDYLHVERPFKHKHFTPAPTENLRYLDIIEYLQVLKRKLGFLDIEFGASTTHHLRETAVAFEREFDINVDFTRLAKIKILEQRAYEPLYERFLATVDPDLVVLVKSAGKEPFIEVCKERGITTIELQHGVFDKYNCNYSYEGYRTKRAFPDFFFSFGEYWKTEVSLPLPDECIVPVGYPYLERKVAEYADVEDEEVLLFVSQNLVSDEIATFASSFSEVCPDSLRVIFKLHPGERPEDHPDLIESDVEIVDGSASIHLYLARSRYLVGATSTAVFEGMRFGVQPFLLDFPMIEMRENLLKQQEGVALVSTPEDLVSELKGGHVSPKDAEEYFKPNPIDNICKAFSKVRNQGEGVQSSV